MSGGDTECWACNPAPGRFLAEQPGRWCRPRAMLCEGHKAAVILPTGERLAEFLGREPGLQIEGEPYSYILNPVTVGGFRGWLHFKFGGYAVLEELFPCSDYAEWILLHWDVDRLHRVFQAGGEKEAVRSLYADWLYLASIRAGLSRLGVDFPRSPAEAAQILRELPPIHSDRFVSRPNDDDAAGRVYQDLVLRRFGHLQGPGPGS
ncbi:MAG: hypothetical protein U0800_03635 [Isosphaeraceae bacterium]